MAVRVWGQYAFDNRLVPQYQRAVGGLYTVRGYKNAATAGDSVFLGSLEYRLHLPRLCAPREPQELPLLGSFRLFPQQPGGRADWDLVARLFTDVGRVVNSDKKRFEQDETLVSVGGGFELQLRRNIQARWDVGVALKDGEQFDVDSGDVQFHFSVTTLY